MKIDEIYTAYVSWKTGGKRRPILVIKIDERHFQCYKITSKYKHKSARIKKNYYPIREWQSAGLRLQSYVDVGELIEFPRKEISLLYVGKLTLKDRIGLANFITDRFS